MESIRLLIGDAVRDLYSQDVEVTLDRPEAQFGDAATNTAMQLARVVGKNPREIAEALAEKLREHGQFTEVTVAGPGFINLRLSDAALYELAAAAPQRVLDGKTYVQEYSCPNAFKELHTGHLYQTMYGDGLARLLEAAGATVHRTSFGGDVGLHVAKCLYGMQTTLGENAYEQLDTVPAEAFARARWISEQYVKGAAAYEDDEAAKEQIVALNKAVYALHTDNDHESPLAKLYWMTRQWSFDYFEAFYDLIRVDHMKYYPESQTAPVGMNVVAEQLEKGVLKRSEGAVVYEGDESKHLHTRVFVTSQGLPTYETKDIGVIWLEKADYDFSQRILITGNDQKEYMRVVFAAAEEFRPELAGTMTHLTNGTVKFADGQKMSSRLGNVTRAVEAIDAVREKVAELVQDESQRDAVTLGAIKYAFAKYKFGGDIAFDIDETVSLAGNSGPYLQYAHARACSILAKVTAEPVVAAEYDADERVLLRKLGEYNEVIERAATEYALHGICHYLYELAQEFNRFYERARIVGDAREGERARLTSMYRDTLAEGLALLGIAAPERL